MSSETEVHDLLQAEEGEALVQEHPRLLWPEACRFGEDEVGEEPAVGVFDTVAVAVAVAVVDAAAVAVEYVDSNLDVAAAAVGCSGEVDCCTALK